VTEPVPVSEDELHALVDRCLPQERLASVQAYLAAHPADAVRVAAWREQREALRAALAHAATGPLPRRLSLDSLVHARLMRRERPWRMAAAVVLAFGLGGAGGWFLRGSPPNGAAVLAQEAMANHAVYAADRRRPTELGADQREDLARWVSNRMNHKVSPPDLSADGFQYMGGRLAATSQGPAGMFMYQNASGLRLTVFVRPDLLHRSMPLEHIAGRALDSCVWMDDGMGYTIVAPIPADELRRMAEQVRKGLAS
jgi:anti-sigma factor RsiW